MNNNSGKELRVGALIAIGLLLIFGAFFVIGGQEGIFTRKYSIKARFVNVEGLTIGAPVRLGGVKVGSVEKINFSTDIQDQRIVICIAVSASSFDRIRKDSQAKLGSQGLLGDRTVDISVGTMAAGPINQGDFINTIETPMLGDLISQGGNAMTDLKATAKNANNISWKINNGSGSLAQIINDPRLYTDLDSLLDLWTRITVKINSGEGFLSGLVNDPRLYDNLSGSLSEIKIFMANLNSGHGSLGRIAQSDSLYNRFDSLLINVSETLAKINHGNGTAGQLVNNDDLYMKVNSTMDALNNLIVDIKKNPKKYVKLSLF
jgi:phospholipid/cholesterol/gamma-HCH transport system substrate-binding protein